MAGTMAEATGELGGRRAVGHEATDAPTPWWRTHVATAIGLVTVGMVVAHRVFGQAYQSDDDPAMARIAMGEFGAPRGDLVFTSPLIGDVLALLYRITVDVPWYALYTWSTYFVAAVALVVIALERPRVVERVVIGGASGIFLLHAWVSPQFTSAAILVTTTGIALFVTTPPPTGAAAMQRRWARWAAAGGLVVLGSLVRMESAQLAVLVGLPLLVVAAWRRWDTADRAPMLLFGALVLAAVGAGWGYEQLRYLGDDPWATYTEWDEARATAYDRPGITFDTEPTAELAAGGLTTNDLHLFRYGFVSDPVVFSTERFEQLADAYVPARQSVREAVDATVIPRLMIVLGAVVAGTALLLARRRSDLWAPAAVTVIAGAVAGWLALTFKLPVRVSVPLAFAVVVAWALVPLREVRRPWLVPAVLAVPLLLQIQSVLGDQDARRDEPQRWRDNLAALEAHDPDGIFVLAGGYAIGVAGPTDLRGEAEVELLPVGWSAQAPFFVDDAAELGVVPHLDAARRAGVHLVAQEDRLVEAYLTYLDERHGLAGRTTVTPVGDVQVISFRG